MYIAEPNYCLIPSRTPVEHVATGEKTVQGLTKKKICMFKLIPSSAHKED
jgi:hypothetical protein